MEEIRSYRMHLKSDRDIHYTYRRLRRITEIYEEMVKEHLYHYLKG